MFLALLFAYVLSQFDRAFLAVVAGDLSRDLGLDPGALGSLGAAWFAAFALAQIPIGLALDRYGPRRVLAVGMCGAVLGSGLLAGASDFASAVVAMGLIGAGCAPVLMAGFYVIARTYPMRRFATMSSLLLGLGSLGDPLSGAPLAFVVGWIGWRGAMLGLAAVTVAAVACVALFVRDPPRALAPNPTSLAAGIAAILRTRALWLIVPVAFVSYAPVIGTRGVWLAPYLEGVHGLEAGARSLAATGMGLAMAGGALLYAPLVMLIGSAKRTVLAGCFVAAAAWLALGIVGQGSTATALALLFAAGSLGAPYAIVMAHARSFFPAHLVGTGVTLMNLVVMGGVAIIQWLSGRYVQAATESGAGPITTYGALFTVYGAALAVTVALYVMAPPERRGA